MPTHLSTFERRQLRVRRTLKANATDRPRLSVFRSSQHIYAQIIDDVSGKTLVAASSLEKDLRSALKTGADMQPRQPSANWWRNALSRPASARSYSIAAAICSTGASRRLRMQHAKPA